MNTTPSARVFDCPACRAPQNIRGLGQTNTYACTSCGTIIDIEDPEFRILQGARGRTPKPLIPLGTRCMFDDIKYELIGYMIRSDKTGDYRWGEYLLFNPYHGFAWLIEFDGHWTLSITVKEKPVDEGDRTIYFHGHAYRLFLVDQTITRDVVGEFYWRVQEGDKVETSDFISPPYMLSLEQDGSEMIWSEGRYLQPAEVEAAFAPYQFPTLIPQGIFANQPFPMQEYFTSIVLFWLFSATTVIVLHIAFSSAARNEFINRFEYQTAIQDSLSTLLPTPVIRSPQFTLTGRQAPLAISTHASVDNNWIDLDLSLVNITTQDEREQSVEVSYYHGYDDEGSWTEGSTRSDIYIPSVTPGEYLLEISPSSGTPALTIPFDVTLRWDVPYYGNMLVALLLLSVYPLALIIWRFSFESKRWQNSSFADTGDE